MGNSFTEFYKNAVSSSVICVDGSYIIYHILYASVKKWTNESLYSSILDDVDTESPFFEHINLLIYDDFLEILREKIYITFKSIYKHAEDFNRENYIRSKPEILFALDPLQNSKLHSWRYLVYSDYKGQRKGLKAKKPFDVMKIFYRISDEILSNHFYTDTFNFKFAFADGCEADDIIASVMMDDRNKGKQKLLIAKDHDYLQLKDVTQITLEGEPVVIKQPYPELIHVTPDLYLLSKIITGDDSDNITQVFARVKYKTACKKFLTNIKFLQESLEKDKVAFTKFKRNAKLIDFNKIPKIIKKMSLQAVYG